jgi:ABC-type transporter Mla MlaB component
VNCWIGLVDEGNRRIVRLAGHLSVAQVPELLKACDEAKPAELDLSDVLSADPAGIEALRRIRKQGTTLVGAPGYIKLKLDSADPEGPASAGGARRLG